MDVGTFDLNTLAALGALLEEGNLTYAGGKVGLAQPTMSSLLARFRRHFNDELLIRIGREHELTPLARDLLPLVQEALLRVRGVLGETEAFDPASSTRLFTIGASDYAMTVLIGPLRTLFRERAPGVRLEFVELGAGLERSEPLMLRHDALISPLGYGFVGDHRLLFHDRLVCVVARGNPELRNGALDLDALRALPHAVIAFRGSVVTPIDRVLGQHGVSRRVALKAAGFLPLVFAVLGTDTVAIVPERLARLFAADQRLLVLDPPFGLVDMLEAVWWHPSRENDAGHRWLLALLGEVADELDRDDPVRAWQGAGSPR